MLFQSLATATLFTLTLARGDLTFESLRYRDLRAAESHRDILRRADVISTKSSLALTYAEETEYGAHSKTFASRVRLGGHRPTLLLEEFDHLLDVVDCSNTTMTLHFRDVSTFDNAKLAMKDLHGGLVVSSHFSCSQAGAHSVFSITELQYEDETSGITLQVTETTFREAFPFTKIEFGLTPETHYIHRHDRLGRRQDVALSASAVIVSAASTLIPTSTPTAESVTFDLTNNQTDTTFSLPQGIQAGPNVPFTAGCKACTTKGQLILTQGEIELASVDDLVSEAMDPNEEVDLVKSGFFQLELNGFESSLLLKASPSTSHEFAIDLFSVPVLGFRIPNFGSAGVLFQPQIVFDVAVQGGIELTWGFDVKVPDHSTIRLDIGQFNNSAITGFDQTTVDALPFNANTSDIVLTLKAGLRPFVPIGISFFGGDVSLLGGPFLDLPYISTSITQLATSNVNENCETGKGLTNSKFQNAFKNLTYVSSELGMGAGFEFEAVFDLPDIPKFNKPFNYSIWSTTTPMPTACLAFEKESGLVQATAAVRSVGAASSLLRPNGDIPGIFGLFGQISFLGLCVVTAVFAVM